MAVDQNNKGLDWQTGPGTITVVRRSRRKDAVPLRGVRPPKPLTSSAGAGQAGYLAIQQRKTGKDAAMLANAHAVTRAIVRSPRDCQWPVGHPGDPDFRFCPDRAIAGKPYCATHCAKAFVQTKP